MAPVLLGSWCVRRESSGPRDRFRRESKLPRRREKAAGFTLVEILIVLSIVSALVLMATISFGSNAERAYVTAMQADLRAVAMAQEIFAEERFASSGRASYTSRLQDLRLSLSPGVSVRVRANPTGWSARATHVRLRHTRCAVFRGEIRAFSPATNEGLITCD